MSFTMAVSSNLRKWDIGITVSIYLSRLESRHELIHPNATMSSGIDLLDDCIADLEAKLHLSPGEALPASVSAAAAGGDKKQQKKKKEQKQGGGGKQKAKPPKKQKGKAANDDQPDICKLEFKVGQISKVWIHPDADKLYCEEIECGEPEPRQIASGLRPYYTEEEMLNQRLLVVSNLKPKNLVGF